MLKPLSTLSITAAQPLKVYLLWSWVELDLAFLLGVFVDVPMSVGVSVDSSLFLLSFPTRGDVV